MTIIIQSIASLFISIFSTSQHPLPGPRSVSLFWAVRERMWAWSENTGEMESSSGVEREREEQCVVCWSAGDNQSVCTDWRRGWDGWRLHLHLPCWRRGEGGAAPPDTTSPPSAALRLISWELTKLKNWLVWPFNTFTRRFSLTWLDSIAEC